MECEQRAARVWPGRLSTPPPAPRMCGVCRLHGDLVPRRGHDPCPLKHCRCSLCDVRRKRLLQKKQREHLGEDQSRERGEEQDEVQGEEQGEESGEEQVERNSEVQDEEQGEQHGEQQREEPGESVGEEQGEEQGEHQEKRQGDQRGLAKKCSLCLQHGTEVLRKGHKACPFENCPCAGCCYVRKRRLSQRKEERKTAHLTSSWSKLQDERQAEQQRGEPAEDQGEEQGEEQGEQHAQQQTGQHDEGQDKTQGEERGEQNGEQQEKQQREEPGEGEDEVQEEEQGGQQAEQQLEEPDKRESEEQGKEQGEQQGKRQEEQRRLVQKCLLCLKHGKEVRWKGHKSCPFENCPCAGCSLVRHRRLLRRKPRPYHKSAPLPNGLNEPQGDQWVKKPGKQHAEHQDKQQAEQEDTQQRKQQRKQRRKQQRKQWGRRSTRKCNLCLKHGNVVSWKGHRDSCPFQSCPCAGCCLVRCRRILGRKRALLSRKSHSHASAAISSPAPGAAAPPVPSSHAFEVFFERAAKMTGENRRREAERLASAVDILCWDKENIEQRNRSATQARSSQRLRRIHLGQTTTSNRIPSIPIGNSDDRLQRGKKRCLLCREHGKLVFTSGHKQCPYEHCPCLRCRTVRRHRLLDKIVHSRKRRLQYTRSGPARKLRARRLADQAAVAAAAAGHSGSAGDGHWAPTEPEAESGDIQSRSPVIFSAYKATRTAWR
ncbi:Reticulocyte-binding protein 2-like protein a, partial [Frankliniella fusca]